MQVWPRAYFVQFALHIGAAQTPKVELGRAFGKKILIYLINIGKLTHWDWDEWFTRVLWRNLTECL